MDRISRRYYTINDLVEMGFASRVTIWKRIKSGELPAIKIGHSVRIPCDEFDAYCDTLRVVRGDAR